LCGKFPWEGSGAREGNHEAATARQARKKGEVGVEGKEGTFVKGNKVLFYGN